MKTLIEIRPVLEGPSLKWEAYKVEIKETWWGGSKEVWSKVYYLRKHISEEVLGDPFLTYNYGKSDFESLEQAKEYLSIMFGSSIEYVTWRPQ